VVNGKIVQYLEYSDTAAMHAAFDGAPAVVGPSIEAAARSAS